MEFISNISLFICAGLKLKKKSGNLDFLIFCKTFEICRTENPSSSIANFISDGNNNIIGGRMKISYDDFKNFIFLKLIDVIFSTGVF